MKKRFRFLQFLFVFLFANVLTNIGVAQSQPYYTFVVIETRVSRANEEISNANPQERRFYISNVIEFPGDPRLKSRADKIADEYFTKTIVEPLLAKGISHDFYEQDVQIDGGAIYTPATRAEAEELYQKTLADLKELTANVFAFTWQYGKEPKGWETAQPKLLFRHRDEPLHEPKASPAKSPR